MPETTGSLGTHFNRFLFNRWWNRFIMFLQACEITVNRIFDISQRFFSVLSLRNTSGQIITLGNEHTVLIYLKGYPELHSNTTSRVEPRSLWDRRPLYFYMMRHRPTNETLNPSSEYRSKFNAIVRLNRQTGGTSRSERSIWRGRWDMNPQIVGLFLPTGSDLPCRRFETRRTFEPAIAAVNT